MIVIHIWLAMTEGNDCVRLVHTWVPMASASGVGGRSWLQWEESQPPAHPGPGPGSWWRPEASAGLSWYLFVLIFVLCSTRWVTLKHYARNSEKEEIKHFGYNYKSRHNTRTDQSASWPLSLQPVHKFLGNKRYLYRGTGQNGEVVIASTLHPTWGGRINS